MTRCQVKRRDTISVCHFNLCSAGNQLVDKSEIVGAHGPVQSGRPVGFRRIDVDFLLEKSCRCSFVALLHGLSKTCVGRRGKSDKARK